LGAAFLVIIIVGSDVCWGLAADAENAKGIAKATTNPRARVFIKKTSVCEIVARLGAT
jgi:hypothetical protein